MNSIRTFLVVILIATITLVNFVTVVHGYRKGMEESQRLFESRLEHHAHLISALFQLRMEYRPVDPSPKIVVDPFENTAEVLTNTAFQVLDSDGRMILRSANSPATPMRDRVNQFYMTNFDGYRWGSLAWYDSGRGLWIFVAEREDIRRQLEETIILESVVPVVAALPLIAIMIWFIVGFGLKPIRHLAEQLRARSASNLSPIALDVIPAELTQLAISANDLLTRLDASFQREKQFNSDVAHELRTPVAAMKIHMQNLMTELPQLPESSLKLQQGIDRMQSLVEQMLALNRMMPENYITQFTNVDLYDLIRRVLEDKIGQVHARHQMLEVKGGSCIVYGDVFALETLVKNLVNNAIKYTPDGGRILLRLETTVNEHVLQVIDSGPGIPESQYERVFERFYRIGGDRQSAVSGCGLGLSIVRYIVDLHKASISLGPSEFTTGLCVTVRFPSSIKRIKT